MKNENYDINDFRNNDDWKSAFLQVGLGKPDSNYGYELPDTYLNFVKRVVCCDRGYNDEVNWICVVELEDGTYVVVDAGCDYTGWDCQAWGTADIFETEGEALSNLNPEQAERLQVLNVGHN